MKKRHAIPLGSLVALLPLLPALHLALPYLVRDYLNDKLVDMGDYRCLLYTFPSPRDHPRDVR